MHADVVGSTSLVQQDGLDAHLQVQSALRRFSDTIRAYGGSTEEIRGDALVALFERASDALGAAAFFQQSNSGEAHETGRPELRVGLAIGEVAVADQTVTGAGVILAQRLEQLAAPEESSSTRRSATRFPGASRSSSRSCPISA